MEVTIENYKFDIRELTVGDEEIALSTMAKDIDNRVSYGMILANKLCYLAVTKMCIDDVEVVKKDKWNAMPRRILTGLQTKITEQNKVSRELKKK